MPYYKLENAYSNCTVIQEKPMKCGKDQVKRLDKITDSAGVGFMRSQIKLSVRLEIQVGS